MPSRASSRRCGSALESDYEFRRVEIGRSDRVGELAFNGTMGVLASLLAMLIYIWFRFEWQFGLGAVIATVHDVTMMIGLYVDLGHRVQPDQHRGDPDHRRLFDQRYRRRLRPRPREPATIQEDADRGAARPVDEPDAVANGPDRRHDAAGAARALSVRRRGHSLVHLRDDLRHPGRHLFVDLRRRAAAHPVQAPARKSRRRTRRARRGCRLRAQPSKT